MFCPTCRTIAHNRCNSNCEPHTNSQILNTTNDNNRHNKVLSVTRKNIYRIIGPVLNIRSQMSRAIRIIQSWFFFHVLFGFVAVLTFALRSSAAWKMLAAFSTLIEASIVLSHMRFSRSTPNWSAAWNSSIATSSSTSTCARSFFCYKSPNKKKLVAQTPYPKSAHPSEGSRRKPNKIAKVTFKYCHYLKCVMVYPWCTFSWLVPSSVLKRERTDHESTTKRKATETCSKWNFKKNA